MKNIVIWGISNYNWLWVRFAGKLKKAHSARIHFVSGNVQMIEYLKGLDTSGIIDTFTNINHFYFQYDRCPGPYSKIMEKARIYEERYGTLYADILQADRHLGRGFFSGGINHPKSRWGGKADYIKSVNMINEVIEFWEGYFNRIKPDLIIGVASAVMGKCCSIVARKRGIPIRALMQAKYQSYFSWAVDEFYSIPGLRENYEKIEGCIENVTQKELDDLKRLPWASKTFKVYFGYRSKKTLLIKILSNLKSHVYRRLKGITEMGSYPLLEDLGYILRMHREMRKMDKIEVRDAGKLKGLTYVFFPLHTEPESSIGMLSPEFNEQLALIELVAKNLPAGVFLVIKEHLAAVGRRPANFYSTISQIPNVIMVHPNSYASDMARGAECVCVISSTLGSEMAILGAPVISFGLHNNYNFLPHVHVVKSWMELRPLLRRLCGEETEAAKARRREDGMRYLSSLKASSLDLSWSDYSSKKRDPATEREIEALYGELMKSLEPVNREVLSV